MEKKYPTLVLADLTDQIHHILRDRILKRDLKPGERILVKDVADALNVSRTPVTDALKRLAGEGLVIIKPRVGTFVTQLTAQDVAELFDVRLMMELHAAEVVLQNEREGQFLAECEAPMQAMRGTVLNEDYRDYEAFITNDRELHLALIRATSNRYLVHIYGNSNLHMQAARAYYLKNVENATEIQSQHEAIVEGFKMRDAAQVRQVLKAHITEVKDRILHILDEVGGTL
jgi:DNA-binding GntR family transcriptional regulator